MWFNVFFFLVNESENVMITLCYRPSFINCACQRPESPLAHLTIVCISSSKKKRKSSHGEKLDDEEFEWPEALQPSLGHHTTLIHNRLQHLSV